MKPGNKTKIVATIGPASSSKQMLKELITAGVNICRINFSHGNYDTMTQIINNIRELNKEMGTFTGILADLQGPKLRIGTVKNDSATLTAGHTVTITTKPCDSDSERIYITYPDFPKDVKIGDNVLIDDGRLLLSVTSTDGDSEVEAVIVYGGELHSRKGVNLPNTRISLPCLTEKDLKDLQFALDNHIEWIGLSFVRSANDIHDLKKLIAKAKSPARVMAKIEKPEALTEIDAIIKATDGVMVARGDLGVELPLERVPVIQKMLVKKCIEYSRPVIVATQMMESMILEFSPTRAEVNDVANAVMDGADAVMLSEETSVGKYPLKAVEYMQRIIGYIELNEQSVYNREHRPDGDKHTFISDTICYNACLMAKHADISAITTMTNSGYTAFKLSSHRPKSNIFIFTDNPTLLTALSLLWGVYGFHYDQYKSTDHTISEIQEVLKRELMVKPGDLIINIASIPIFKKGRANMMKLSYVE
jgi:pyruvate kinase